MPLVFLLYALFASVFILGKWTLSYTSPLFLVGSRMAVAGLLILAFLALRKGALFPFKKRQIPQLILLGITSIYLVNVLEFWGLQYLTSFKTCFIYSISPFVSAILSYFIFSESLSKMKWLGLSLGFAGFIPILLESTPVEETVGQLWIFSWPEIAVTAAAILSCWGWILMRGLVKESSPIAVNGWSMLIGGLVALFHSYSVEAWDPLPVLEWAPFLEGATALLLVSNLFAYNLYGYLLKKYTATFISFAGFTTPLFTALFGYFFLDEWITWPFALSYVIVYIGLRLFYREEVRQEEKEEKVVKTIST